MLVISHIVILVYFLFLSLLFFPLIALRGFCFLDIFIYKIVNFMKYLKKFNNHTEYETYMAENPLLPNVSYCVTQDEVHFTPEPPAPPHDYSDDYFTVEAVTAGSLKMTFSVSTGEDNTYYSLDNGDTWSKWSDISVTPRQLTLSQGDKVLFKKSENDYTTPRIKLGTAQINVYGNIMSWVYGDNFASQTTLTKVAQFQYMFDGNNTLISCENLVLPATTLSNLCYSYMFQGCTSLTTAPELPALTLTQSCYANMFDGCSSLTYVKMLATDVTATSCVSNWMRNVSATGTFIKNANAQWTEADVIPSGWTVQTA